MEEIKIEENKNKEYEISVVYKVKAMHKTGNIFKNTNTMRSLVNDDDVCEVCNKKDATIKDFVEILSNELDKKTKKTIETISEAIKDNEGKYCSLKVENTVYMMGDFSSFSITYEIFVDGKKI